TYAEFSADRRKVVGGAALEAFAQEFVQRPEFAQRYGSATTADQFVNALLQVMKQASGVDLSAQRSALVAKYQSGGSLNDERASALREAIDDASFKQAEYNPSFVLMQYFGYLKRDPDAGGYQFWL